MGLSGRCRIFASLPIASLVLAAALVAGAPAQAAPHGAGDRAQSAGERAPARSSSKQAGDKRAAAKAAANAARKQADTKPRGPRSIGAPNAGRLAGGVRLKPSGHLRVREGASVWALPVLAKALHRAADVVARKHPGSVMLVGDLSAKDGGPLQGHNSHQSGRDADVGFYVASSKGKPAAMRRFLAFGGDGQAREPSWARFDDARNWTLVEALLEDERAHVRYVFVSTALRARLLRYATKKRVAPARIQRAAAAMISPDGVDVHDDHFHVRLACPESMRGSCTEESAPRERTAHASGGAAEADPSPYADDEAEAPEAKADTKPPAAARAPAPPARHGTEEPTDHPKRD